LFFLSKDALDLDLTEKTLHYPYYVADIGRNAFNLYIETLTFLSISPVQAIKAPALTYNIPGTNQFRKISFPSQQVTISPPLPISSKSFLSIYLNNEVRRIIAWLRIGLQEKDIITSFLALFTCIEILSHQFENGELRISRKCPKCGFEEKIRLGTKQILHNFLVNEIAYSEEKVTDLWETRNKLVHGGYDLSPENKRALETLRNDVVIAIIRGIKKLVGLQSSDFPPETNQSFPFTDPILDVEYTTPE
jgi:hypothetical protein